MLEEMRSHQQKIIKADHIKRFIRVEYGQKPDKILAECKTLLPSITDRNDHRSQYHEKGDDREQITEQPCSWKPLLLFLDHFLDIFWR